jgi:hypothetical protein
MQFMQPNTVPELQGASSPWLLKPKRKEVHMYKIIWYVYPIQQYCHMAHLVIGRYLRPLDWSALKALPQGGIEMSKANGIFFLVKTRQTGTIWYNFIQFCSWKL